jgi:hypothetical protein
MTTVDRLLPLAFGLDRLAHCLRVVDVIGPKARVTVELDGAELPRVIEHRVDLPAGARRDATLRLTLAEGRARPRVWEGRLDALNDATPPTLAVSKVRYDALRGTLQRLGLKDMARRLLDEKQVTRDVTPAPKINPVKGGMTTAPCGMKVPQGAPGLPKGWEAKQANAAARPPCGGGGAGGNGGGQAHGGKKRPEARPFFSPPKRKG